MRLTKRVKQGLLVMGLTGAIWGGYISKTNSEKFATDYNKTDIFKKMISYDKSIKEIASLLEKSETVMEQREKETGISPLTNKKVAESYIRAKKAQIKLMEQYLEYMNSEEVSNQVEKLSRYKDNASYGRVMAEMSMVGIFLGLANPRKPKQKEDKISHSPTL
ncbi:hypothetical protein GOV14_03275 [Candidatus Pacearchaeota archaeon]|nr:hypothetical protein [Candidatus Pacearchaeota archaeon]